MIQLFNISALKCQQHPTCNRLPFSLEIPNISIGHLYRLYWAKTNSAIDIMFLKSNNILFEPKCKKSFKLEQEAQTQSVWKYNEKLICLSPSLHTPCAASNCHLHHQRSCHRHQHFLFCQVLFELTIIVMKTIWCDKVYVSYHYDKWPSRFSPHYDSSSVGAPPKIPSYDLHLIFI